MTVVHCCSISTGCRRGVGRYLLGVWGALDRIEGLGRDRPRDVQVGPDRPLLRWRKRKWLCPSVVRDRKVFTEAVPGVPARAPVTPRAKASMATEVLDKDRSMAAVASDYRCWHTMHDHVVEALAQKACSRSPQSCPIPSM